MSAAVLFVCMQLGLLPAESESVVSVSPIEGAIGINEPGASLTIEADPYLLGVVGHPNAPLLAAEEVAKTEFNRTEVLKDFDNRIDDQFAVPQNLEERVGFWFDIYTKYDQHHRVIHHQDKPWIIFKVVNVTAIINASQPRVRWLRNEKADKFVKAETERVRAIVQKISKGAPLDSLNSEELEIAQTLSKLNADIKKAARQSLKEIRVQTGQKNFFEEGLAVSPRYLKTMEKIFRDNKLPVELTRLPFVESSFNKHATSKVGATGIWQFMGNTGRKFMLVNEVIDERRSPFKATEGAARLLKENHMILGRSWPMAITAWNHGPSGIRKAFKAARTKDLGEIVSKYRSKSFDFASSNFYCEFLAALHAEKYNDLIFGDIEREAEMSPMVVKVARSVRVKEIVRASGLSNDEFLLMNPDLRMALKRNTTLPFGFRLHVPLQSKVALERLMGSRARKIAAR